MISTFERNEICTIKIALLETELEEVNLNNLAQIDLLRRYGEIGSHY